MFEIAIALSVHFLIRNEAESCAVDAVTEPAPVLWTVSEDMAEMGSAAAAPDLNPVHAVASVLMLRDHGRIDGLREARPAAAGFKFIGGREEGFPRRDININTAARILPVLPGKGQKTPGGSWSEK